METIVLMGPAGAGKTTQAKLLSKELGQPVCTYDDVKEDYRRKAGFDKKKAVSIQETQGTYALICYLNVFKAKTLGPIINDHPGHIIDLGGGAQCFDEDEQIETAKKVFAQISEVFMLIPSRDLATNITTLPGLKEGYEVNTYLIMHPTNELFPKKTVYTLGKTPKETMSDIVNLLGKDRCSNH